MIRTLLADDESMIRAGISAILAADPAIEVVGEAGDGREAIELARRLRPDVALVDIRMPGITGITATAEIRRAAPEVAVSILTTFGEDAYIKQALGAGASGFLLKSGDPRELLGGVHAVADGAACLSPQVARRVLATLNAGVMSDAAAAQQQIAALSDRERDVLVLLAAGLTNTQIAHRLHIVEGTVKAHVSSILVKTGATNRVQAALIAYQAGLIDKT
jgi:DNA-binding NarL/FixJ family response regulator